MLSMERHQYILRYLEENGNSTRKELAKLLNVTIMTIGRDFKKLEEKGLIIQTHGGAALPEFLMEEKKYERKKEEHTEIKRRIAKKIFQKIQSLRLDLYVNFLYQNKKFVAPFFASLLQLLLMKLSLE